MVLNHCSTPISHYREKNPLAQDCYEPLRREYRERAGLPSAISGNPRLTQAIAAGGAPAGASTPNQVLKMGIL
jgi:hypothetical protein